MRVLQFGFSDRGAHIYLPHQYVPNTVAYTGTHDNDTMLGWWKNDATVEERAHVQRYLEVIERDEEIVGAMMRAAARSVAKLCIFTMQDILRLGSEARMNTPSNRLGNWSWRYRAEEITPEMAEELAELMELTDRDEVEETKVEAATGVA
jgi:4-alpha-glucanotransferase